jgi:hypothetical protein
MEQAAPRGNYSQAMWRLEEVVSRRSASAPASLTLWHPVSPVRLLTFSELQKGPKPLL